jgi:hypothetical protein
LRLMFYFSASSLQALQVGPNYWSCLLRDCTETYICNRNRNRNWPSAGITWNAICIEHDFNIYGVERKVMSLKGLRNYSENIYWQQRYTINKIL